MDNLSLQKYLLATGFLKDIIQDSLDIIVTNGKFNDVSVRRALDTKYLPVMKKSNPIDVVFKDKVKFDTHLIGNVKKPYNWYVINANTIWENKRQSN